MTRHPARNGRSRKTTTGARRPTRSRPMPARLTKRAHEARPTSCLHGHCEHWGHSVCNPPGITLSGILDAALQTPFRHSRGCAAPPRRQIFPSRLRRSSHSEEPRPMRPDRNNFPTGGDLCHGHVWPASLPRPIGAIGKAANRDAIFRPGLCQSRQHSVNFVAGEAGT